MHNWNTNSNQSSLLFFKCPINLTWELSLSPKNLRDEISSFPVVGVNE